MVQSKPHRINREITQQRVKLVRDAGAEEMSLAQALYLAGEQDLDLVEVSSDPRLSICKIMDYGKFLYEKQKKTHKPKVYELKEIKIRPSTDDNDYLVKLRKIKEFLTEGHKVKVSLRFKGREMAHQDLGKAMLERIRNDTVEEGHPEGNSKFENRQLLMILAPGKKRA